MKGHKSLSVQLTLFVLADLIICLLGVFMVNMIGEEVIDQYYFSEKYAQKEQGRLEEAFRKFAKQETPLSSDWETLSDWVQKEGYVLLSIYKQGYLVFDSEYGSENASLAEEKIKESEYDREQCMAMKLADGAVDVELTSLRYLACYNYLLIGSGVGFALLFLIAIFIYTGCKFRYISLLSQEVQAVEQGELTREITVRGQDEIAVLADSMEKMRNSFSEKILTIEQLQKERSDLVAEMSHDMRTPLTALMMYLGFLKDKEYNSEEAYQDYANKALEKACCIKSMMDDMFFFLKMDREKCCELEQAPAPELLYEFISEIVMMLEAEQFTVEENIQVPEQNILFCSAYMGRIAGNVVSNIRKYADRSEPVKLFLHQEEALVRTAGTKVQVLTLTVRNRKVQQECPEEIAMESMGFGIRNVQKMMELMAGDMFCAEERMETKAFSLEPQIYYELRLMFRVTGD